MITARYRLKDAIVTDNLTEAFEYLRSSSKGKAPSVYAKVIVLEDRYLELKTNSRQETMPRDFIQIEMNKIRKSLIALVDNLSEISFSGKVPTSNSPIYKVVDDTPSNPSSLWDRISSFFKNLFEPSGKN